MFNFFGPFARDPVEQLLQLYRITHRGGGGGGQITTVTGVSPLVLANALHKPIRSLTQYGKCTQASTPTPDAPVDIVCNNGALRYGALGQNLLDPSAANTVLGYYVRKEDGDIRAAQSNFMFAGYIPVEPGKTYVAYGRAKTGDDLSDYNRVAWYDSNKNWLSGASYTQNRIAVVTAPENAAYALFSCNPSGGTTQTVTQEIVDSFNWMFAEGTAEVTPFAPFEGGIYTDGTPETLTVSATGAETQIVTAIPMLLSAGDAKDEAEIISGGQVHKVGVYVFTGDETLSTSTAYGKCILWNKQVHRLGADAAIAPLCTHFSGLASPAGVQAENTCFFNSTGHFYFRVADNDTTAFKADLAAKYAAGTPVILLFALAEETTEQGTAHALHTTEGENLVDVTAAVGSVELEVEFVQAAGG